MEHSLLASMSASARQWGALWGHDPRGWAATEAQQLPAYSAALRRVSLTPGDAVLDVGCATGVFLRLCADRGALAHGIDASEGLLAVAQERVPEAELRLGDLQSLPYPDDSFDLVTGFTSFFFADDIVAALREAGRVARPGAPIVIQVFGRPEHCAIESMKAAVMPFREGAEEYWRPGIVEDLVPQAGLVVAEAFDDAWAYEYADAEALMEGMLAAGGAGAVGGADGQLRLRAAILAALADCRRPDGGYSVSNEWHFVIARG
jgi:ubiquinone/menaquinone biosynthesis C-methylase UbiE